jgi:flavin-dependent dehydrogenase
LPPDVVKAPGVIQNVVKGARIRVLGKVLELRKRETAAYVIDRDLLDKRLADYAISSGADIKFGVKAEKISVARDKVMVKAGKSLFESNVVAGCGGAHCIAARHIGAKPPELLNGLVVYVDEEDESDYVDMWFDRKRAPGGFLWRIPRGPMTEFGGMGKGLAFSVVDRFFEIKGKNVLKRSAAPIPIGLVKTHANRMLLVGDSACQTKPWSGGGVTYGLLAAQAASDVIRHAVEENRFSERALSEYERDWKGILLKDIQGGLVLRELYRDLGDAELSKLIINFDSVKRMEHEIDFDFPFSTFLGGFLGA